MHYVKRRRPLWACALALVAIESLLAGLGVRSLALAAAALVLSPGLALIPVLPERLRVSSVGTLAAVPALGFAASSVCLITLARAGVALDGTSTRLTLLALLVAGLLLPGDELHRGPVKWELVGVAVAVAVGVVLESRVIGGRPVPGNDWAKYVLYADEIRRQGALLIDNPYWMLGVPFREDPGVPSSYGALLAMTGVPAAVLAHGIWAFAVMGVLSAYAYVRAVWSSLAAALAALLLAAAPAGQDILGWHGLANVAALALLPLALLFATTLVIDGLRARESAGLGLILVALAAAHRLSSVVALGVLVLGIGVLALWGGDLRRIVRGAVLALLAGAVIGAGVIADLIARGRTFGGTQGYGAYLSTRLHAWPVIKDLSLPLSIAALAALVWWLAAGRRRDKRLVLPLALLVVALAGSFAWLVHIPLAYLRMVYYLPLALAVLVGVALSQLRPPRVAAALGLLLALTVASFAWVQAPNVRSLYGFLTPASLRGLNALDARLGKDEVVVTDRCWSFLATWLLHTRTLPALTPSDIQPRAEVPLAARARAIVAGTPSGARDAQRLGVRFVLVDPTCADAQGRPLAGPRLGVPVFVSDRLVIFDLPPAVSGSSR